MFPHAFFPAAYFPNPYFNGSGGATWKIGDYVAVLNAVANPFGVDPGMSTATSGSAAMSDVDPRVAEINTAYSAAFGVDPSMTREA